MSFKAEVTIDIDDALAAGLTRARTAAGIRRMAEDVRDVAKTICPVRTGRLRDSIGVRDGDGDLDVYVGTGVDGPCGYGGFVELGTVKMVGQPFLMPALDTVADGAGTYFEEAR